MCREIIQFSLLNNSLNHAEIISRLWLRTILDAHSLRIDCNGHIWITDTQRHTAKKLRLDETVVMTLGKDGVPGETSNTFNTPTSVLVTTNGDIFITDGYGNQRVVKFDQNGKFIKAWGSKGDGEGQFLLPHDIVQDSRGRLFVAERCPLSSTNCMNGRTEIFDDNGHFLDQGTILDLHPAAGARIPLYLTRLNLGGKASAASLASKSSGSNRTCVVPSRQRCPSS